MHLQEKSWFHNHSILSKELSPPTASIYNAFVIYRSSMHAKKLNIIYV